MKRRLYYYGEDVLSKSFLILPKELVFTESLAKMSAKSKILYCVLRERLILSARNNWKMEESILFTLLRKWHRIYFTAEPRLCV